METRQVIRAVQRGLSKLLRRSGIEAGSGGRRWDGASTIGNPQASTLAARGPAKNRAAAASINTPFGQRAVEAWTSALVGKGWQARSQHPDKDIARRLSSAFEALANPLLPIIARALVRDGEAIVRTRLNSEGHFRVQLIPSDQLDPTLSRDLGGGARIVSGIEFDAEDEVVAYHILPEAPGTPFAVFSSPVRVPARDIFHVFDPMFPGQVRGLSWLAPVLTKLRDRDEASDAMLMQLKVASLLTAFIRDPDGSLAGFEGETDGNALSVALEPGAARILPPGADVTMSNPPAGLSDAVTFLKAQDREIAAGLNLTFEQLTADLSEANYSSARVGLLEFRRRAEMLQKLLVEGQFLSPLWRRWIELEALSGRIEANGAALEDYMAVRFVPPGWQWVDPQKEVSADVKAIEAGLKSREEVVAGRGRDIDELDEERARDRRAENGGEA